MQFQYGTARTKELIRLKSLELRKISQSMDDINVDDALAYFERRTDVHTVREAYKDRYAIGIQKKQGEGGYEKYTKQRIAEAIDQGMAEIITVGTGPRINNARATLFTNKTQSWDWVTGEGAEKQSDEQTAKTITEQRKLGGFSTQLPNADYVSCAIETGPLYVDWLSGHLNYRAFSPNCFYAAFGDSVLDNGVERGVDYQKIDDAYCVVILLSGKRGDSDANPHINQYIAYFGRSEEYPFGRRVSYEAQHWYDIPKVDKDARAIEYRLKSGEPANPLSWIAAQKSKEGIEVPEYPVCLFKGGISMTADTLVPISTSLYEACLEIDIAMSRLMKSSLTSALGVTVVTNELGHELPRLLEGVCLVRKGQTVQIMGQPVSNSQGAMEVTKDMMRAVAEGFSVPGYQVIEMPGGNPESGIALMIRNQPIIDDRERRININKTEVERLWNIERYLYEFVTNKPLGSADTKQVWNPGRYIMPESETEKITRLKTALDSGAIDYVRFIRDAHNFATDKESMEFIDKMNDPERLAYKAPKATGAQRTGLPLGLSAKLQQPQDNQNQDNQENQNNQNNQPNFLNRRGPPS